MSTNYEKRKEELERILKAIYNKYHGFSDLTIYYKIEGRDTIYRRHIELKYKREFCFSEFLHESYFPIFEIALRPNLEYAVYVSSAGVVSPSKSCIEGGRYIDVLAQFASIAFELFITDEHIRYITSERDPLRQLLLYRQSMAGYSSQHTYLCPYVVIAEPYSPDPASIFPGRKGLVASCITFADFVRLGSDNLAKVSAQLGDLMYETAHEKLENSEELKNLREKDPASACNVSLVEKLVHNEIEEANRLMKQYGIIHVAFPLD